MLMTARMTNPAFAPTGGARRYRLVTMTDPLHSITCSSRAQRVAAWWACR